ncbi:MAG TPA: DUF6265 family protein [Longimicrobiales bacterium]|nr:DUF6265 family protein [Longimicrobiales bacterium]
MTRARRTRVATVAVALVALGAGCARAEGRGRDTIERLAWLAGCWERRAGERLLEEQWMRPRGGTMLGMSRLVRGSATLSHESMRIEERDGGLVFAAQPSGQAPAEFASQAIADSVVVFENATHDFPQRVIYRHAAGDSLHARIEGERGGEPSGIDFRMARVACTD